MISADGARAEQKMFDDALRHVTVECNSQWPRHARARVGSAAPAPWATPHQRQGWTHPRVPRRRCPRGQPIRRL